MLLLLAAVAVAVVQVQLVEPLQMTREQMAALDCQVL